MNNDDPWKSIVADATKMLIEQPDKRLGALYQKGFQKLAEYRKLHPEIAGELLSFLYDLLVYLRKSQQETRYRIELLEAFVGLEHLQNQKEESDPGEIDKIPLPFPPSGWKSDVSETGSLMDVLDGILERLDDLEYRSRI